ncbi:MAG: undecaprenyl/decaprenyl-phosphate alpha-N-acetylglucosaminyl 1-phosphate transferase [Xanthomonadaceae bacterium]|nr:undecaprenyl/decaprenyl-phosphate alpha-N-acetylglucosaminyl 1-phosphate transferase [Xanthomonadaceae bacterium]
MSILFQAALPLTAAFAIAWLMIPLLRRPALRQGLIDHPDHRKRHVQPTPLTGGLAIIVGLMVGLALLSADWSQYWSLFAGMLILLLSGLADDLIEVPASVRMLIQIGVACLMVFGSGMEITSLGQIFGTHWGEVGLGPFSVAFTIACVVFIINAINMIDGLDGLAGGTTVIMASVLAIVAMLDRAPPELIVLPLLLAAATLGFLLHNYPARKRLTARAFLGDSGSMMLGYAVAWFAIALGTRSEGLVYPISIAWLLIIPAMDTLALFFRRIRMGRHPFSADRTHLHHILRRCGYPVSGVVQIMHLMVALSGLVAITGWLAGIPEPLLFAGATAILLGYQWFLANAHRFLQWHQRQGRRRRLRLKQDPSLSRAD